MIQQLIIEGHDSWVLAELWGKHLSNPKGYPTKESLKHFFTSANGVDNMPRLISTALKTEGITNLGIIVDANENGVQARWEMIKSRLAPVFNQSILSRYFPQQGGIIIKEADLPTVGVWIMPDNQANGYLESFLTQMLPTSGKNDLWQHILAVLEELKQKRDSSDQPLCEFPDTRFFKALVRTWLAWQKDPGLNYGTAMKTGYFDSNALIVKPFLDWIARTFELET